MLDFTTLKPGTSTSDLSFAFAGHCLYFRASPDVTQAAVKAQLVGYCPKSKTFPALSVHQFCRDSF